jgi:hypothetical protein
MTVRTNSEATWTKHFAFTMNPFAKPSVTVVNTLKDRHLYITLSSDANATKVMAMDVAGQERKKGFKQAATVVQKQSVAPGATSRLKMPGKEAFLTVVCEDLEAEEGTFRIYHYNARDN